MKFRFLGLIAVVVVFVFASVANADRFSLESDLSTSLKKASHVVEKALAKLETGGKVKSEVEQLQGLYESISAIDLLYRVRLESQLQQSAEMGGLANERQAQLFQKYTGNSQELLSQFEKTLAPNGFSHSNLRQLQKILKSFLPHKDRPIHGLLPYQHLNYSQVDPQTSPVVTPAYQLVGASVNAEDTAGSPEAPISAEIVAQAEALGWSPVAIYEWMKNNVTTEWYWGAMKGAEETLRQQSGNDADQATLLVALLRASGYPARYVQGLIEFFPEDISTVVEQTGVEGFARVGDLFRRAGIPYQAVNGDSNYRIEHIWVETKVPYANYRGVVADLNGEAWLPLDTSLKVAGYTEIPPTVDLVQDGHPGNPLPSARDNYLATSQSLSPLGQLQVDAQVFLDSNYPGQQYSDILATRTQESESLSILPGSPQFKEIAVTGEYASLPPALLHAVQFSATLADATPLFDISLNAHELSNRNIAVSYEPESVEDQEIINSWGGLGNTPAYLVRLRPVLLVDGKRIVVAKEGLAFGETFNLQVKINAPRGTVGFSNVVEAGYPQAIGLASQKALVPDPATLDQSADALMYYTALDYIDRWNTSEDELSALLQVAVVRPVPAVTTIGAVLDVTWLLGVPQGVTWKGLFVDADLRAAEPVNRTLSSDEREKRFMQLSAIEGSELESWVFEDPAGLFGVESISTAELFGLVHDQAVAIHTIDQTNVDTLLPTLGLAANMVADIDDAVRNQGLTVQVPAQDITLFDWTGTGYIKENLISGEAGYMLSGALAGSSTVMGLTLWPPEMVSAFQSPFGVEPSTDPAAAKWILKVQPQVLRTATAGEELDSPLMVLVLDQNNTPVEGAPVVFSVAGGGAEGYLIDDAIPTAEANATTLKVFTGRDGIARARFKAGELISAATPIGYKGADDPYAHIVGQNLVSARLDSGSLLSIASPFTILAFAGDPDPAHVTVSGDGMSAEILSQSGGVGITLEDQFGNGVANWQILYTALSADPRVGSLCTDMESYAPADKAQLVEYFEPCLSDLPVFGECPTATTALVSYSASFGTSAPRVILGGVPYADYPIEIAYETPAQGMVVETVKHYASTYGSCGSAQSPDYELLLDFDSLNNARPAGQPAALDFKAYLLTEGEKVQAAADGGVEITCGEEPITCAKVIGDGHYSVSAADQLKVEDQYISSIPGENGVVGLFRYNGSLPLGLNTIQVEATAEKDRLKFNHGCDACDQDGAEEVSTSFGPKSGTAYVWGVDVSVTEDFVLVPINASGYSTLPVTVNYLIRPAEYYAGLAQVWIYHNDILESVFVPPASGRQGDGSITIPAGYWFNRADGYTVKVLLNNENDPDAIFSQEVPIRFGDTKADGRPTMVTRVHLTSQFDSTASATITSAYVDKWDVFSFRLDNAADVTVTLLGSDLQEKATLVPEANLAAGDHKFLLTYEQARNAGISPFTDPEFYLQLDQKVNGSTHTVLYKGKVGERTTNAKMLGQTMVHDVLIQEGLLSLSRQDFALKGRGPQLAFSRSYNNQSSPSGFKPLGRGWSHGFDMRLQVRSSQDNGADPVPAWVTEKEGVFYPAAYEPPGELPNVVQVNGTMFKKHNSVWYAERAKHGRLAEITGGYEFTAKDGTLYRYDRYFDGSYYVTAIEDRNGNTQSFAYDGVTGHLATVTDAAGRELTFTTEIVAGIRDDNQYRITSISGPDGISLAFNYDVYGYLTKVTRGSHSETYEYAREAAIVNADFNLVKAIDSNGYSSQYEYHPAGAADALVLYTGFIKSQDVVKSVTYPDGLVATFDYDVTAGNKRTVTDLRGNATTYTLNNYGNPLRIDEPLGKYTEMTWSIDESLPDNVMTSQTLSAGTTLSPRALTTLYEYDGQGNVIKETDPYSNVIASSWDPTYSLPLTRIDRNGVEQRWSYDPTIKGCLTRHEVEVTPGVFTATDSTCYPSGEVATVTDPLGNVTRYSYDLNGNPDLVTVAEGTVDQAITDYTYDIRGRKTDETDPLGNQTSFSYDELDYPATVTLAEHLSYALPAGSSRVKTTVYDAEGNLLSETDRVGLSLEYTYTPRNQVETITRRDAGSTLGVKNFSYDGNSNLLSESDWKGFATTHTYNALNQRDTTKNRLLDSMSMAYDLAGNLIQVTDFEGRVTDYEYDDLNRQTRTIQPKLSNQTLRGEIVQTYYLEADPKNNLRTVTDAEGHSATLEYNGRYQKTKRINALLDEYVWQYDAAGNLEKEIDEELNETRYEYDAQNRPTFTYRALNDAVGTFIRDIKMQELRYDAAGNVRYVLDGNDNISETVYDEWNRAWKTITPVDAHAGTSYTSETLLDGEGRETSVRNLAVTPGVDQLRTFLRDARGLVFTATDAEQQPTTFTYDLNDNLETVTNALGYRSRTTYDLEGRKLLTTEAEGTLEQRISGVVTYDKVGNPLEVRDGNGNTVTTDFNVLNLPWKQYNPAPFAAQFVETKYDLNGKPISVTNRLGHVTTTSYDALGRVDTVTDPVPFNTQTIVTTYDKVGNVRTVKDKRGIINETLYDSLYRPIEQQRDGIRLITSEYDDAGNPTAVIDAENNRTEVAFNSRNLPERTTYIDGVNNYYSEQFYDGVGNLLEGVNEEFEVTSYSYDRENRQRSVTFAGETTETFYDELGNPTRVQKPKLNDTAMAYDGLNRLISVTEGGLLVTAYSYDANNNQLTQTDPLLNVVEFSYDTLNRKTAHIQHKASGNLTVSYDLYDAEGNLKQMTDAKGQLFSYDYDELNRPTKSTYPLMATSFLTIQDVVIGYDANNNVASVTETKQISGGGTQTDTTVNLWDNFDRLDLTTQRGIDIDYGYDNNGNRTSVVTVNGTTSYTYDHLNRIETAVVGADTTSYTYTPDGQTDTVSYPNGTTASYSYWPSNRVETITHTDGAAAVISSYDYQYDANGNRIQQIEVQGGVSETTSYVYDGLDRMESYTLTSGTDTTVTTYTFEGHNRKTETVSINAAPTVDKTYTYDETNWLTTLVDSAPLPAVTIGYQYDANGNTILKTDSSKPGMDMVFDYDVANRMVETTQGATSLGRYDYNAQGMRVRHYGSERGDVSYYYDDGAVLEEYLEGAEGGLLAHYRYGDRLLSLDAPGDGGVQYYHHDALGSTVNLTDSAGTTKVSYTLDPWGHIRNQVGASVNRQVFTGQEHDENTGLIYFGARYYDPDTARFISQDSYLGEPGTPPSLHRYLYAYSNPTVWVDLDGYRSATAEEEETFKLREETASKYQASYEAKSTLGRAWDVFYGDDYQRARILENLNVKQKAAIESAADGEAVIAVPNPVVNIQVDVDFGDGEAKVENSVFLTASQAKFIEQYSNLTAAANAPPAAIAMAIDPDNTPVIQVAAAAWDIVTNTGTAMHSRASNPTVGSANLTVESRKANVGGVTPKKSASATKARIKANIAENKAARKSSNADKFFAKSVQVESGYNADEWQRGSLREGNVIYSLSPNRKPEFFTSLETLQAGQFSSSGVSRALQVSEHPIFGYRPDVTGYRVKKDFNMLHGKTLANPQLGPGGGDQYLIKDYEKFLEPITTIDLQRR